MVLGDYHLAVLSAVGMHTSSLEFSSFAFEDVIGLAISLDDFDVSSNFSFFF